MIPETNSGDMMEIVYPPHVGVALGCLLFAFLILLGLATVMLVDWLEKK